MNKHDFMSQLRNGLAGLPDNDIEERLIFYGEMIDDRIEEGVLEEAAVAQMGSISDIISQILSQTPITKLVKEKISPKRKMKVWEIILLILGSPIWLSLLIAVLAATLSLYIVIWAVIIVLWSVDLSFAACAPAGIASGILFIYSGDIYPGIAMIAAGLVCAGLAIFTFYGCKAATNGLFSLTKKMTLLIKKCFIKEESK